MNQRRWLIFGIVALIVGQVLVWLFAGWIWWSFRGGLVWPGQEPSPSRVARDSYVAMAFFVVAAINVAALMAFLARPRMRSIFLLTAIQAIGGLAAIAFTLMIDRTWILITALAVAALALLYMAHWSRSATTFQPTKKS
jgi:hypothetical protein